MANLKSPDRVYPKIVVIEVLRVMMNGNLALWDMILPCMQPVSVIRTI